MQAGVLVNPFHCRMWALHDRLDDYITEETCKAEIASVSRYGQLVRVLGRPLHADPTHKVELIYGARRLFVARHLNVPLLVELRELSDREAIVVMETENTQRQDISPYERGRSYAQWLRVGHFKTQEEIAKAINVSPSQVSRLLKQARLPAVIMDAFGSPYEISEGTGLELIEALADPTKGPAVLQRAREVINRGVRLPAREVHRQLLGGGTSGRRARLRVDDDVIRDEKGRTLFKIQRRSSSIVIQLPINAISARSMENIRLALADILQRANLQVPVSMRNKIEDREAKEHLHGLQT